jgi:MFS family permease
VTGSVETPGPAQPAEQPEGPASPWAIRDFRLLWVGRVAAVLGIQIQSSALLWQVYEIARRDHPIAEASLYLGLVGLCQFLPLLALTLPAGALADRRDRKNTVTLSVMVEGGCALAFLFMALHGSPPLWGLLAVAAVFGAARAFLAPASQAFLPMVVGRRALPPAIAAQSIAFQTGAIAGPALGGVIVGFSVPGAYGVALVMFAIGFASLVLIRTSGKPAPSPTHVSPVDQVKEGLAYVWNTKIVLGAISLDLIVVLLAGVALLTPIFARDILHVGAVGFGLLRASFGAGALLVALYLSRFPIVKHAGRWMFASVAVFGHDQRQYPPDPDPAGHARSHARAGVLGVDAVHRRLERVGRSLFRRGGALPRPHRRGGVRRDRGADGDQSLGAVVPGPAEGGSAGVGGVASG